jgi:hypothetical protein
MAALAPRATSALTCIEHIEPPPPVQNTTVLSAGQWREGTFVFEDIGFEGRVAVWHVANWRLGGGGLGRLSSRITEARTYLRMYVHKYVIMYINTVTYW